MLFLIRCVFWLSLVFSTIFSPEFRAAGAQQHGLAQAVDETRPGLDALAQSWLGSVASFVRRQAVEQCLEDGCIKPADVRSLLVGWTQQPSQLRAPAPLPQTADVPLPPRRPHFPGRGQALEKSMRAEYVDGHMRRG